MYKVKFRGKSTITGEIIYGIGVKKYPDYTMMILDCLVGEEVDPDSIAQFVGYDKNGREVYEGDELVDLEEGYDELANLMTVLYFEEYEIGEKFEGYKLKEK